MNLTTAQTDILKALIHVIYSGTVDIIAMIEVFNKVLLITDSQNFAYKAVGRMNRNKIKSISNNSKSYEELYAHLSDKDYIFDRMAASMKPTTLLGTIGADYLKNPKDEFSIELTRARPVSDICYIPMIVGGCFIGFSAVSRDTGRKRKFSENDIQIFNLCCQFLREGFIRILRSDNNVSSDAVLDSNGNVLYADDMLSSIYKKLFGQKVWETPGRGCSKNHEDYQKHVLSFLSAVPCPGSGEWNIMIYDDEYTLQLERLSSPENKSIKECEPAISVSINKILPQFDSSLCSKNIKMGFCLTDTEMLIADKINSGLSNAEIAGIFCISEQTVKRHIYNIFQKTGVSKRSQLMIIMNS